MSSPTIVSSKDNQNQLETKLLNTANETNITGSADESQTGTENLNPKLDVLAFLEECRNISFLDAVKKDYFKFFNKIYSNQTLGQYHKMFKQCLIEFYTFPKSVVTTFLIKFIIYCSVEEFINFNCVCTGFKLMTTSVVNKSQNETGNDKVSRDILSLLSDCKNYHFLKEVKEDSFKLVSLMSKRGEFRQSINMFHQCICELHMFPKTFVNTFVIRFIINCSVEDFINFNCVCTGFKLMIDTMGVNFEKKLEYVLEFINEKLSDDETLIMDSFKTETHEIINTSKDTSNMSVISDNRNHINSGEIYCYFCSPYYLALNQDQKLDENLTLKINPDLSSMDRPILRAIKCFEPKVLSMLVAFDWESIKAIYPESLYLKVSERAQVIHRYLEYNFTGDRFPLPTIFSTEKFIV